jgi:hypothetical protein
MHRTLAITALVAAALNATAASAAPITWNLSSGASGCSNAGSGNGNSRTCTASGESVTASAWSNTAGQTNVNLETAQLGVYGGGLGVTNRDAFVTDVWDRGGSMPVDMDVTESAAPEHAIDNNDRYDSVFLNFGSSVTLTGLNLGYVSGDSDFTVLAFTGIGAPTLGGAAYGSLVGSGWSLIGHYANAGTGAELVNAANISSRYWLVGAFNPLVGGNTNAYGLGSGNDHFKLYSVTSELGGGTTGNVVPEPASLAMLGAGLVMVAARLRARR